MYTFETNSMDYILQPHVFSLTTKTIDQSPDNKSLCHGMEKTIGEISTMLVGRQWQLTFTHNTSAMSNNYVRDLKFMLSLLKTHWHADCWLPTVQTRLFNCQSPTARLLIVDSSYFSWRLKDCWLQIKIFSREDSLQLPIATVSTRSLHALVVIWERNWGHQFENKLEERKPTCNHNVVKIYQVEGGTGFSGAEALVEGNRLKAK